MSQQGIAKRLLLKLKTLLPWQKGRSTSPLPMSVDRIREVTEVTERHLHVEFIPSGECHPVSVDTLGDGTCVLRVPETLFLPQTVTGYLVKDTGGNVLIEYEFPVDLRSRAPIRMGIIGVLGSA